MPDQEAGPGSLGRVLSTDARPRRLGLGMPQGRARCLRSRRIPISQTRKPGGERLSDLPGLLSTWWAELRFDPRWPGAPTHGEKPTVSLFPLGSRVCKESTLEDQVTGSVKAEVPVPAWPAPGPGRGPQLVRACLFFSLSTCWVSPLIVRCRWPPGGPRGDRPTSLMPRLLPDSAPSERHMGHGSEIGGGQRALLQAHRGGRGHPRRFPRARVEVASAPGRLSYPAGLPWGPPGTQWVL